MNPEWVTIRIELIPFLLRPYIGDWIICLHKSGLSFNSFRIEFIPFFILDRTHDPEWNIKLESCEHESRFHSGMKSTFIMAEIKIIYKMGILFTYLNV